MGRSEPWTHSRWRRTWRWKLFKILVTSNIFGNCLHHFKLPLLAVRLSFIYVYYVSTLCIKSSSDYLFVMNIVVVSWLERDFKKEQRLRETWTLLTLPVESSFFLDSTNSPTICVPIWYGKRCKTSQQRRLITSGPSESECECLFEVSSVDTHWGTALALHCTSQSILSWRANVNLSPWRQNYVPSLTQLWPSTFSARSYLVQYDVLHLQLRPSRWVGGSIFFGGNFRPLGSLAAEQGNDKIQTLTSQLSAYDSKISKISLFFNGDLK